MRRILAITMAVLMLTAVFSQVKVEAANTASSEPVTIKSFESNIFSVVEGEAKEATFTADVKNITKKAKVKLCDSNGFITYMNDNGTAGDAVKNDGIYTAKIKLMGNKLGNRSYHAEAGNAQSSPHTIKYRKQVTDNDFAIANRLWDKLSTLENGLADKGYTNIEIANQAYDYLKANYMNIIADLHFESEKSFSFTLKSGIENYFEHIEYEPALNSEEIISTVKGNNIDCGTIGVWSPYYGLDESFTLNYKEEAEHMAAATGYSVDAYYGRDASLESFKSFDKYGIIMIDSHGADYRGGGYVCVPYPGGYDPNDVADGLVVLSGSMACIGGAYIQKYCNRLPNSIIYTGICLGLATPYFYSPLLNHGAGFVAGFDESVSFTFDGKIMKTFCDYLVMTNTAAKRYYNTGEAYNIAIAQHGMTDPYSYNAANFIYYGNTSLTAYAIPINIEKVEIAPVALSLYNNNTQQLNLIVQPSEANSYTTLWSIENPEIATIDQNGLVTAIKEGLTFASCIVTDTNLAENNTFTARARITVNGNMPVSGINIIQSTMVLYKESTEAVSIMADVLPANASNHSLTYKSEDTSIATVSGNGFVLPVAKGETFITVTTVDGGYSGKVLVKVIDGNVEGAFNKTNGKLSPTNSSSSPLIPTMIDGRYAVQTTNHSSYSKSTITLNASQLKAGYKLIFDWKVSSEQRYDTLSFIVNGNTVKAIDGEWDWDAVTYTIPTDGDYRFSWTYAKDYAGDSGHDCGWIDNVDIIGDITHTVTFTDGGEWTIAQTVSHGENAIPPMAPTKPGYVFVGWSEDYTQVRADVTTCAIYEEASGYTVTFIGIDGNVLATEFVEVGGSATPPTAPTVEGYIFVGWQGDYSNITAETSITAIYRLFGDANLDNTVNTGDAVAILKYAADMIAFDDVQLLTGDFNGDSVVNTGDAVALLKILAMG